ncbi:hypothetical protein DPMN_102499 [Dreissena polymorpha]|uniref:Uncharacterized protein n=1 Tax=Dreissena polymorpha TaxID=45954 RepID=A0A9D4R949_DREPO|nr:hypothetical protein DPMN_102499 [Dreissena polymorpha]
MRDMTTEDDQEVSLKGVGEGTKLEQRPGISFSMNDNDITVNSSDQLKPSLLVNHSLKEIAKLQRNDPDVGFIIHWMKESLKPSRDAIAGESPAVRNL